jgi:hypothetical protein
MRSLITSTPERSYTPVTTEQAAWIIVAAAERLSGELSDKVGQSRYANAARRMRHAVRARWSDDEALRAASPTFTDDTGRSRTLLEVVTRFRDDAEAEVQTAMTYFLAFDWRLAS